MKTHLRLLSLSLVAAFVSLQPGVAHAKKRKEAKKTEAATEKKEEITAPAADAPKGDEANGKAGEKKAASYTKMPYGMAGCGWGSMMFKNQESKPVQILASIFNGISGYTKTSAMSSGTSNCVHVTESTASAEQSVYMNVNLAAVSREAAKGSGMHLDALAEVFGCANHMAFAQVSQGSYESIFNSVDADVVLRNYRQTLLSNEKLVGQCERVN